MKNSTITFAVVMVLTAMILSVSPAKATDISGTIVNTVIITQDSRLTGDVICNVVVGTPCIFFAAPRIELKMNGHSMTGKGARDVCPAPVFGEYAISTNGQNRVSIEGPGLITNFRDISVFVTGDDTEVEGLTIVSGCTEGIHLEGSRQHRDRQHCGAGLPGWQLLGRHICERQRHARGSAQRSRGRGT